MLTKYFLYKRWADRRAIAAIRRVDHLVYKAEATFLCQQLNHMVIVEELFKSRLLGEVSNHVSTNTEIVPNLDELESRLENSNEWYFDYASKVQNEGALDREVRFSFVDGKGGTMSRQEILFHIINHGTYHRGAIGHKLDVCFVSHPADTYTVFIHEAEPIRR